MTYHYIVPRTTPIRYRNDGGEPSEFIGMLVRVGDYVELQNLPIDSVRIYAPKDARVDVLSSNVQLSREDLFSV